MQRDFKFIRYEIESEDSQSERGENHIKLIKQELSEIENWVEEKHKDKLTFQVYTAIGDFLSRILSYPSECCFKEFLENFEKNINFFQKKGRVFDYNFEYLELQGITVPHISKTGIIAEKTMNQGFGFFGKDNKVFVATFYAVPTDYKNIYDVKFIDVPPMNVFVHDVDHSIRMGLRGDGPSEEMAKFRKILNSKKLTEEKDSEIEMLIFKIFHESLTPINNSFSIIKEYLKNPKEYNEIETDLNQVSPEVRNEFLSIAKEALN